MGRVKLLTPKPRIHTREIPTRGEGRREIQDRDLARGDGEDRRRLEDPHGDGELGDLGHNQGAGGSRETKK